MYCQLTLSDIIYFTGITITRALFTKTVSASESLRSDMGKWEIEI